MPAVTLHRNKQINFYLFIFPTVLNVIVQGISNQPVITVISE